MRCTRCARRSARPLPCVGDGAFVETVYCTSEEEARQRESMPPPPEMAQAMQEEQQLMDTITYLDLHQPWLVSPAR